MDILIIAIAVVGMFAYFNHRIDALKDRVIKLENEIEEGKK